MGRPQSKASGLPGKRVDASLAGITTTARTSAASRSQGTRYSPVFQSVKGAARLGRLGQGAKKKPLHQPNFS